MDTEALNSSDDDSFHGESDKDIVFEESDKEESEENSMEVEKTNDGGLLTNNDIFDSDNDNEKIKLSQNERLLNKKRSKELKSDTKRKKVKSSDVEKFFEKEAEESGEDNEKDEEDSDEEIVEENEKDQYVADGFVIMESEDEEEEISKKKLFDSFRKPKQLTRLKKKKNTQLEIEDMELIQEHREKISKNAKTKIGGEIAPERVYDGDNDHDMDDDGDDDGSENEDGAEKKKKRKTDQDGKGEEGEEDIIEGIKHADGGYDDGDESDIDDFIDNDYDGDGTQTQTQIDDSAGGAKYAKRRIGGSNRIQREQINEALEIFGEGYEDYDMEGSEEDDELRRTLDEEDEDLFGDNAILKMNKIRKKFERNDLIEIFCTDHDDVLRNTDVPERYIDIMRDRGIPDIDERNEESIWMSPKLVVTLRLNHNNNMQGIYDKYNVNGSVQLEELLVPSIENVLRFIQVCTCIEVA